MTARVVAGVAGLALSAFSFPRLPVMVFRSPYLVAYATEPFCAATLLARANAMHSSEQRPHVLSSTNTPVTPRPCVPVLKFKVDYNILLVLVMWRYSEPERGDS
jgi:hypothetical protein